MFGLKGIPLKIDKLGYLGTVEEVIVSLNEISKDMKNPRVVRLGNEIAVFDIPENNFEPVDIKDLSHHIQIDDGMDD